MRTAINLPIQTFSIIECMRECCIDFHCTEALKLQPNEDMAEAMKNIEAEYQGMTQEEIVEVYNAM